MEKEKWGSNFFQFRIVAIRIFQKPNNESKKDTTIDEALENDVTRYKLMNGLVIFLRRIDIKIIV